MKAKYYKMKRMSVFFMGFLTLFIMLAGISLAGPENSEYDQIIKNRNPFFHCNAQIIPELSDFCG
jgi:hypothetical protein